MPIFINKQPINDLPLTIGSAGDNDLILESELVMPFHAVLLKDENGRLVFMTADNRDREGGKSIQGGVLLVRGGKAHVRLAESGISLIIEVSQSDAGWVRGIADESLECPVCKGQIKMGDPVWKCGNCELVVHDSQFCRPESPREACFRCGRR